MKEIPFPQPHNGYSLPKWNPTPTFDLSVEYGEYTVVRNAYVLYRAEGFSQLTESKVIFDMGRLFFWFWVIPGRILNCLPVDIDVVVMRESFPWASGRGV